MKKIITTILALGLATTLMGCSKSETKQVDDVAWQTVIDVEKYKEVEDSGWVLPDDAELITTKIETKQYKKVLEYYKKEYVEVHHRAYGYNAGGSRYVPYGYTTRELQDVPVYKWLPIDAPKYYYKQWQWVHSRVAMEEGLGHDVKWADPGLADDEREGIREAHYYVRIGDDEYNIDRDTFSKLNKGDVITYTVDSNSLVDVEKEE